MITDLENEINQVEDLDPGFKFRVLRDKARNHSILCQITESQKYFQLAEDVLPKKNREMNVKYAKLMYLKGLASKRISHEAATEALEESLKLFAGVLSTQQSYHITMVLFELAGVSKKQKLYDDASDLYQEGGKYLPIYLNDPMYGEFAGKNHPMMQQYYILISDLATSQENPEIESQALKDYVNIVENANRVQHREKKSIFLIESKFLLL